MLDQVPIDQTIPASTAPIPAKAISIAGSSKRARDDEVRSGTSQGAKKRSRVTLPLSMRPGFIDSETSSNAMSQFLIKFVIQT